MEKIVINGLLYKCKNGTNDKIKAALAKGDRASPMDHEKGISHYEFNELLWGIIDSKNGEYIENVYQTS